MIGCKPSKYNHFVPFGNPFFEKSVVCGFPTLYEQKRHRTELSGGIEYAFLEEWGCQKQLRRENIFGLLAIKNFFVYLFQQVAHCCGVAVDGRQNFPGGFREQQPAWLY